MEKFIKNPFAVSGDKTTIPDPLQIDGSVSYTTGFGEDYAKNPQTQVICTCSGTPGTLIPAGSSIVSSTGGYSYQLIAPITLDGFGSGSGTFQSMLSGFIPAPAGTVNKITLGTAGWTSVTNPSDAFYDSTAKKVPRYQTNQVLFDITSNINLWQIHGLPDFITTADNGGTPYPYDNFSLVRYNDGDTDENYVSLVDSNIFLPTDNTKWSKLSGLGAITGEIKTGVFSLTSIPFGWIPFDEKTIGGPLSNATGRANDDTLDLFTLIWNGTTNTVCPLLDSTGTPVARGVSASADFAADRAISLPRSRARSLGFTGSPVGLTSRALGDFTGVETVSLTSAQNGSHSHVYARDPASNSPVSASGFGVNNLTSTPPYIDATFNSTNTSGAGDPHQNMQPTAFFNAIIKL